MPIPTYYGDEICHVNGLKYAADIFTTMLRTRAYQMNVFFGRKFDVNPPEETYDLKLGLESSHTAAIAAARPGSYILDVGCGQGYIGSELVKKGCPCHGEFFRQLEMLDDVEHEDLVEVRHVYRELFAIKARAVPPCGKKLPLSPPKRGISPQRAACTLPERKSWSVPRSS